MASVEVNGRRFNTAGVIVESVKITVGVVGDTVHLTIQGDKIMKYYAISKEDWNMLHTATPY